MTSQEGECAARGREERDRDGGNCRRGMNLGTW